MNENFVIDLSHHFPCSQSAGAHLERLFEGSTISEILDSLGGVDAVEIRFSDAPCEVCTAC